MGAYVSDTMFNQMNSHLNDFGFSLWVGNYLQTLQSRKTQLKCTGHLPISIFKTWVKQKRLCEKNYSTKSRLWTKVPVRRKKFWKQYSSTEEPLNHKIIITSIVFFMVSAEDCYILFKCLHSGKVL